MGKLKQNEKQQWWAQKLRAVQKSQINLTLEVLSENCSVTTIKGSEDDELVVLDWGSKEAEKDFHSELKKIEALDKFIEILSR